MNAHSNILTTATLRAKTAAVAQNKVARIAGGCYLAFILASVLADRLGHIGLGSAEEGARPGRYLPESGEPGGRRYLGSSWPDTEQAGGWLSLPIT